MGSSTGSSTGSVRNVVAGDTRFLLREEGGAGTGSDGVPVLLLHGVPETSTSWRRLAPALADGRRVLAPDLPGLGGSAYPGPYDLSSLTRQLVALLEEEGTGPVDVVGHDWGGALALSLARARPDLVRRLCVANAPYRSLPLYRAVHVPLLALPVLPELLFRAAGPQVVDTAFRLLWKARTPPEPEALAEYRATYSSPAVVRATLGYYRAAVRPRVRRGLRKGVGGPLARALGVRVGTALPGGESPASEPEVRAASMLVLWGARDPVLPVRTGEAVVRDLGPDAVMVTVPEAGHFVVEEAPDVVAEVLQAFLAPRQVPPFAPAVGAT
jgi:pimeloyl-ACP methyl ester carboxylesterase